MAKKRKSTPQAATLHDFFGKAGRTPPKKVKVEPTASQIPIKCVDPGDIIVIDSDDDDLPKPSSKAILCSSERDASLAEENSFGLPLLLTQEKELSTEEHPSTFGTPALLTASTEEAEAHTSPSNRPATPLDGCTPPPISKTPSAEVASNVLDNEWRTGDDEMELDDMGRSAETQEEDAVDIDLTLDDDVVDIDLTLDDSRVPSQTPGDIRTCPLCNSKLVGMSDEKVQEHVNHCIDTMSSPVTRQAELPPPQSTIKQEPKIEPLRPVSSYQPAAVPSSSKVKLEDQEAHADPASGVFSVLMTSHKENEAWKEASAAEDRHFRPTKGNGGRRKAPFYKVMQGMPIAVDAFRYGSIPGVTAYFLTHAHSDHYTNLSAKWSSGPIYCSEGTANLIIHMLGVDPKWVHALPLDVPTTVPDTGGVQVTLIEANHCPGSCLFLFEGTQTVNAGDSAYKSPAVGGPRVFRYLHCGDFRASPAHVRHPAIRGKRIDHVYLDTTYLDPKYCFPPQPQVIEACAGLARRIVAGIPLHEDAAKANQNRTMDQWVTSTASVKTEQKQQQKPGRTLVVVGTYSIGKERIVKAIAKALQTKVFCDSRKAAILRCQADPELHALLTKDPLEGGVHLVPLGVIASDRLKEYVERFKGHYSKAVGFRPTGWTFSAPAGSDPLPAVSTVIARAQSRTFTHAQLSPMKNASAALQVYGVPYSEHSSFFELTCFALSLDWARMIATVNVGSEKSRKKMGVWIERWEAERKKRNGEPVPHRAEDYW